MIYFVAGYFASQVASILVSQIVRLARLDVASFAGCLFGNVLVCAFVSWCRICLGLQQVHDHGCRPDAL